MFAGIIDEISIYSRALSSNEIAAIYNAGSAGKCSSAPVSGGPAIFNFSPTSGAAGAIVTIFGTNFSATVENNRVCFGALPATVLAATPTSLTVIVPARAVTGPLTVTVNGATAYAETFFLVTFSNVASTVVAWGDDSYGQTNVPAGLTNVIAITTGACSEHNLALNNNGTVVAWGENNDGQATVPAGLNNVVAIAAGGYHNLVLKNDGSVTAWGLNSSWEGFAGQTNVPMVLTNAVAVAAGWYHSLAVTFDGHVMAWGYDGNGQTEVPASLSNVVAIAGAPSYNLALKVDGSVATWGTNYQSSGGTNYPISMAAPPDLTNAIAIAAGYFHCVALKADGTVVAWGDNTWGQTNVPAGLSNVVGIAAGSYHSLAVKADGTVVDWGIPYPWVLNQPSGLSNVVAVSAGYFHSVALMNNSLVVPPVITGQPTNQTVAPGGTATFTVTTTGTPPLIYQWSFNGTNLAGATDSTLTLLNVQVSQAGNYAVLVTNLYGAATSSIASLTVIVPPPPPSCLPAPSGLVGWWKGEGNANDSAGTNNGALSPTGATYAAGEVGQGFCFDGTNGYVQIPDSDALKPANVTLEAWVWLDPNLPANNGGEQIVFKKNTWSAWFEGYSLLKGTIDNGDGTYSDCFQFVVSRDGDQVTINSQTIAQRGVWYHVAATYDGNQSELYVNGVLEASATPGFALDYDTTPIFIGTSGTWAPYLSMFGGIIDEVSIYNRALSSNEIAAIYNAGSAGKCQVLAPPMIVNQPVSQTNLVGDTVNFSVAATGTQPLIYQWGFDGTNLVGATDSTLTLTNVQASQAGNYSVLVTNLYGAATSSVASLTVIVPAIPPTIVSQTPNQIVLLGSTATFSVTVSGSEPLSYWWSRNGMPIPNATNSSYTLLNAQLTDSGSSFSCLVTNLYGSAASSNMLLKVLDTISNDLCSGAVVITSASYTNYQSTLNASSFGDPTPDCVDGFGHGVWYQFTAPVAGLLEVDTFGSDFDTGLAIYTGMCDALTEVACNDDFGGVTLQITMPTTAGTTYLFSPAVTAPTPAIWFYTLTTTCRRRSGAADEHFRGGQQQRDFQPIFVRHVADDLPVVFQQFAARGRRTHQRLDEFHLDHRQCADQRRRELFSRRIELGRRDDEFRGGADADYFAADLHHAAGEPVHFGRLKCELLRRSGRHAALQLSVVFER